MIIRIITEDKNPELIRHHCAQAFDAFTMYRGLGYWKGTPEPSVTIEIVITEQKYETEYNKLKEMISRAETLAKKIKTSNNQEAVLVEYIHATTALI